MEPFGGAVEDFRAGLAPAMYRNLKRQEGDDPVMPLEFYPWRREPEPPPKPDTPEERARQIRERIFRLKDGDG